MNMNLFKSIGGYFELELKQGKEFHSKAIKINTGRNAFEYILKVRNYKKVFLPYYTCDVMLEPIHKMKLEVSFYNITNTFEPVFDLSSIKKNDVFVYTNYFGICDHLVRKVASKCKNLIIDNSQAFFSKPINNVDTFYSIRKFFGVPDGAYLYTNKLLGEELNQDISYNRCAHLLGRIDTSAEEYYKTFKENEENLKNQPIKLISNLTRKLLENIDYETVKKIRVKNFLFLHKYLKRVNNLNIIINSKMVPMVYPLLIEKGMELKKRMIENKIYCATYWPNVFNWVDKNSVEYYLAENLILLPIDQRYSVKVMKRILEILWKYI